MAWQLTSEGVHSPRHLCTGVRAAWVVLWAAAAATKRARTEVFMVNMINKVLEWCVERKLV
jgi:hypothetical protein